MHFLNEFAKFMRNSGPVRFFVPVGILLIAFGGIMLWGGDSSLLAIAFVAVGILAIVFGIMRTVRAFRKSKVLGSGDPGRSLSQVDFSNFRSAEGVAEYYCRHDGVTLKPGYVLEDADRRVLFEGKMLKNSLAGARTFEFSDHTTGSVTVHEVGHTVQQAYNDEFFSVKGWFKIDGKNIWDLLHERGLRMSTDIIGSFPKLTYEVARDGEPFAIIETSGQYVHEDEAAMHSLNIPVGRYYYRVWTNTDDFETLFLAIFAFSESEQTMVE